MTAPLLLGVMLLGNVLVCSPQEMLAPPAPVRFDSVDYKNILQWSPTNNNSTLLYYVQWKIYGEAEWLDVSGCQGVKQLHCDLSSVTSDPRQWYYARARAVSPSTSSKSAWSLSPRFSPRLDTQISPPTLRLNVSERGIVVRVKPPRPQVRRIHRNLRLKIYVITTGGEEEVFQTDCCSRSTTLKDLHHKSKYCLQAQIVVPLQARSSGRSPLKCVTTV